MYVTANVHIEVDNPISGNIAKRSVPESEYGVLRIGETAEGVILFLGNTAQETAIILRNLIAEANNMLETLKESQYVH